MNQLGRRAWHRIIPWLFVGPTVIAVVVFLYLPILASAALSVLDWNLLSNDVVFVGARNYRTMLASSDFGLAAANTALYCLILVPAQAIIPLILAALLMAVRGSRLAPVYRGALFLPTIVAYSVAGVAWSWLLNPVNGLFNEVLLGLGLAPSRWHTDPDLALASVSVVTFWKTFGLNLLLWLAALSNVPQSVREAARMDGAGRLRRFFDVDLPMITPTAFFVAVTTLYNVLDDIVGVIDVLTEGGPSGRSSSLPYFLWQQGLRFFQFGQASVVALVIIVAVLAVTALQFRFGEHRVHY